MDIKFVKAKTLKEKPDQSNLPFGRIFTDYMFTMDYDPENGWHNATIEPYGPISLDPSACVFHYAQEVFEGTKAYKTPDGHVQLFRPQDNFARLNRSAKRLCIPPIDEDLYGICQEPEQG